MKDIERKRLSDQQLLNEIQTYKDTLQGMHKRDPYKKIVESNLYYLERELKLRSFNKLQLKLF